MGLKELVLKRVCEIPAGKVTTYRQLAKAIGRPKAWRAVANILSKNPHPIDIPCHRVIRSDGRVGGYIHGKKRKIELLKGEGVRVDDGRVNLKQYLFNFGDHRRR